MKNRVSIIIPVFENSGSLRELNSRLNKIRNNQLIKKFHAEVIFIDDGSTDNSWEILKEIHKKNSNFTIIKHTKNFGAMSAIKSGLKIIKGEVFIILSADLQDPPELIIDMIKLWENGEEFVYCERIARGDPFATQIFSRLYYKIINKLTKLNFPKNGMSLILMDNKYSNYLMQSSKANYLPVFMWWLGVKPSKIAYSRETRDAGKSMWTFSKKLKVAIDTLLTYSQVPLRFMSLMGITVSLISFMFGVFLIYNYFTGQTEVRGYTSIVVLISFFAGISISMLGLIGEYLWRIFENLNQIPESVIEKIEKKRSK